MPRLLGILLFLITLLGSVAAMAQEARIVTGQTPGTDPGARDRAIDMAVREAVLQAIQEIVPARRITPYEPILEQAGEYLAEMRIVDYDVRDGSTRIEIAAVLLENALRAAIAERWLAQALAPPRVVVLVAVRNDDEPYAVLPGNPAQALAEEIFEGAGMRVVGLDALTEFDDPGTLAAALTDETYAQFLAQAHLGDAAVILMITVTATAPGQASNLYECTAEIRAIVGSPQKDAPIQTHEMASLVHGAQPEEAAQVAMESAVQRIMPRVKPMAILAAAAGAPYAEDIVVTIDGEMTPDDLDALRAHFGEIPGVEEVRILFHGVRGSRVSVRFPSNPGDFIEPALATLPPTLSLEVEQIVDRDMQLKVRTAEK